MAQIIITEDYVSLKTARLLKEKGFDVNCITKYRPDDSIGYWSVEGLNAPTLQMAMKWLRKVHNLHINTFITYKEGIPYYQWSVDNLKTQDTISETPCYNAYEKACDEAIQYCLENLI